MRVSTTDLRRAVGLLLQHLEDTGRPEFEINEDYYWFVPEGSRFNPYEKPKELTLGQLTDDWVEVKAIADGTKEPIGYALVWLSQLLLRIGEKAVS